MPKPGRRLPPENWVYCVAVSQDRPGGGGERTFRQYVADGWYFHPDGINGWPDRSRAPAVLAFRWDGHVQRICRVSSVSESKPPQAWWPEVPRTPDTERPHFRYELCAPLPVTPIPCGAHYRASRRWIPLDALLAAPTLARVE